MIPHRVGKERRRVTHGAGGVDAWPLHGDGDAVEEDDDQHDVVEHLVGDDLIAQDPKPDKKDSLP